MIVLLKRNVSVLFVVAAMLGEYRAAYAGREGDGHPTHRRLPDNQAEVERALSPLHRGDTDRYKTSHEKLTPSIQANGPVSLKDPKRRSEERTKELIPDAKLTAWFHRFIDVTDHAEEWVEVAGVLAEGRRHGYLAKAVTWHDDQYTPLHYAAEEGDLEIVQALTEEHSIDVDTRTGSYLSTPLHLAAQEGHLEIAQYLIRRGADWGAVDSKQSNALHYAALGTKGGQNVEVIKFLLESIHADPLSLAHERFSLLYLAIKASNISLVKYIAGKFPELLSKKTCEVSPLEFAEFKHEEEIASIIQQKLREGNSSLSIQEPPLKERMSVVAYINKVAI